jgi:hypothetical protein
MSCNLDSGVINDRQEDRLKASFSIGINRLHSLRYICLMTFIGFGQNFVIAFAGSRFAQQKSIFLADILAGEGLFKCINHIDFFYTLLYPIFHLLYA